MVTEQFEILSEKAWNKYDPDKRATKSEIDRSIRALAEHPIVSAILDSASIEMVVVNRELQIVAANRKIVERTGEQSAKSIVGKRLGEAILCVNTDDHDGCCGSSDECSNCGATRSVLASIESGRSTEGECVIENRTGDTRSVTEYSIRATPVTINDMSFNVVALQDISDSKRRAALERVFVHDLKNTLTGLIGWSEDLSEHSQGGTQEAATNIESLARRLAREIDYHRILKEVEARNFKPRFQTVYPEEVIENVEVVFSKYAGAREQSLERVEPISGKPCHTDRTLLERVLINMVKNALEATEPQKAIKIGCTEHSGSQRFFVWNEAVVPDFARAHIFERSFTTKGEDGRGLGTYSMKLFGETVLKGRVWFESTKEKGTTFFFETACKQEVG